MKTVLNNWLVSGNWINGLLILIGAGVLAKAKLVADESYVSKSAYEKHEQEFVKRMDARESQEQKIFEALSVLRVEIGKLQVETSKLNRTLQEN